MGSPGTEKYSKGVKEAGGVVVGILEEGDQLGKGIMGVFEKKER